MDIKALKNQIIDEINSKMVSLIQHPTFKKTIYKESFEFKREFRYNKTYEECIKRHGILHLPLSLIMNTKHEFAKRYINHVICFNACGFEHADNPKNIVDFIEISGANWSFNYHNSPLSSRGIETLMAMNDTLDTYDNIIQKKNDDVNKIMSTFNTSNPCFFKFGNGKYCQVRNVDCNPNNGIVTIHYYDLEDNPFNSQFGKFRTDYASKYSRNPDELMKFIEIVTIEDINKYLDKCLNKEISKFRSEINKAENKIVDLKNQIAKLLLKNKKS